MADSLQDDDTGTCEQCSAVVLFDEMVQHIDVRFCSACDAGWCKHFADCRHRWEPWKGEWEAGRYCSKCGAGVEDGDAMTLFPLLCDGWVDVDAR